MATVKAKKTPAKKKKGLNAKQEAERERLEAAIEKNEARLANGSSYNGQQLTPTQIDTTKEILKTQRQKLEELVALIE
jgi:hypothetical protein